MRISGILLIGLALFHMFWLHFVIGVENISFDTIVQRWNDPAHPRLDLFWRLYDLALLAFAFTHGVLGANYSVRDYVHALWTRKWLQAGLVVVWLILFVLGGGLIFFFNGRLP
jgi:succinate dehydrogenase / fumarate reductase membrane anchor subunit